MDTRMLSTYAGHAIHLECTLVYIYTAQLLLSGGPFIQGIIRIMKGVGGQN